MPSISPREELLNLQKRIFLKNKKIIDDSVIPEDASFKDYERRYKRAVGKCTKVSSVEEMESAVMEAGIIYVGDYHTLNQSQRSFLRILRSIAEKTTNFCIALEVICARHQEHLDSYMKGRIGDRAFLKKTGFRKHWFYDLWENFRPIFDFARYHSIPLYGIEASPDEGGLLKKRDEESARLVLDIYRKNPGMKIFVFVGDLHIAPSHLPREVEKISGKAGISVSTVTLYQNGEAIYWELAEKGIEHEVQVVNISGNEFCRMHTPPIIVQQSFLNWLEHEEGVFDYADAKQTFLGYIDRIAGFLDIQPGKEKDDVEVFTCGDLSFLKRLRDDKTFAPREIREIKRQILRSESYTIPGRKFVYLANMSVNHAAEEASHMLRHFCAGEEGPRPMQDAFYANIIHEALGFFGSEVINHRRKCLRPTDAKKKVHYLKGDGLAGRKGLQYRIARLFLEHEEKIKKGVSFHFNRVSALSVDLFLGVTHAVGYYLGEKMFYGLLAGQITKEYIRSLFYDPMEEEGEPLRRYLEIEACVGKVKLPRRV